MLVLTRKEGESIICSLEDGREAEIVVIAISSNQISLGIKADDDIKVTREELLKQGIEH